VATAGSRCDDTLFPIVYSTPFSRVTAALGRRQLETPLPKTWIVKLLNVSHFHYNLACYESQLGNLEEAKARCRLRFKLDPDYRRVALADEDLQRLWAFL
jgi:hypothetical protein